MDEQLLFVIRSIADGAEKGFLTAAQASEQLGEAYAFLDKQEKQTEKTTEELARAQKELAEAAKAQAAAAESAAKAAEKQAKLEQEAAAAALKEAQAREKLGQANVDVQAKQAALQVATERHREAQVAAAQATQVHTEKTLAADQATKQYTATSAEAAKSTAAVTSAQDASTGSTIGATAAVMALLVMLKSLNDALHVATAAYVENRNALVGLKSIAEGTGQDFSQVEKSIKALTEDGLLPLADAATAMKNLLSRGFGADEAIDIINRLKDSASFGRQASLSLGDAVRSATEGIKNENSILVDNAGVTKNVSKMWEDYARAQGISVKEMTIAQKRQAEYNGIMEETKHQIGDAAKYSAEFGGSQAALEAATLRLKVALGAANAAGVKPFNTLLKEGINGLTKWVENGDTAVAFIVAFTKAFVAGAVGVGAFTLAYGGSLASLMASTPLLAAVKASWDALWVSITGPAGWIIGGVAAAIAVLVSLAGAEQRAREEMEKLNNEARELVNNTGGASKLIDEYEELSKKVNKSREDTVRLESISLDLVASYGMRADGIDEEGRGVLRNINFMKEQLQVSRDLAKLKMQEAHEKNQEAYDKAKLNIAKTRYEAERLQIELEAVRKARDELKKGSYAGNELVDKLVPDLSYIDTWILGAEGRYEKALTNIKGFGADIQTFISNTFDLAITQVGAKGIELGAEMRQILYSALEEMGQVGTLDLDLATQIAEAIGSNDTLRAAFEKGKEIRAKIEEGMASESDLQAYAELQAQVEGMLSSMADSVTQMSGVTGAEAEKIKIAYASIGQKAMQVSVDVAAAAEKQNKALSDALSSVQNVQSSWQSLKREMNDHDDLQRAIDTVRAGEEASNDYSNALAYLAQHYGVTEEAARANVDAYQADADMTQSMIQLKATLAGVEIQTARIAIQAMNDAGKASDEQTKNIIKNLDILEDKLKALNGTSIHLDVIDQAIAQVAQIEKTGVGPGLSRLLQAKSREMARIRVVSGNKSVFTPSRAPSWSASGGGGGYSGGGGGGYSGGGYSGGGYSGGSAGSASTGKSWKQQQLEAEYKLLNHNKALGLITAQQEIDILNNYVKQYAETQDEIWSIDERIYGLRQQIVQSTYSDEMARINHLKATGKLGAQAEINQLMLVMTHYAKTTEQKRELEVRLYSLREQLAKQSQEAEKKRQEAAKKRIEEQRKLQEEHQKKLQEIRNRQIQAINSLYDALESALKKKYDAQQKIEEEKLRKSKEAWSEWADAQTSAIDKQIQALDKLTRTEDRNAQDARYKRDIAALQQSLKYENDLYNQRKLQQELDAKNKEYGDWKKGNQRDDLKAALQVQKDEVSAFAQTQQEKINKQIEANRKYYDAATEDMKLRGEIEKMLLGNQQAAIIGLLQKYAPEYANVGKSMGEQLIAGFKSKVGDVDTWMARVNAPLLRYQQQMSATASLAAAKFWSSRNPTQATPPSTTHTNVSRPTFHIVFNSPVESPAAIAREIERLAARLK